MKIAQELYEGIDDVDELRASRLDHLHAENRQLTRPPDEALAAVRVASRASLENATCPPKPIRYAAGKLAQEAHEGRPSHRPLGLTPDRLRKTLDP